MHKRNSAWKTFAITAAIGAAAVGGVYAAYRAIQCMGWDDIDESGVQNTHRYMSCGCGHNSSSSVSHSPVNTASEGAQASDINSIKPTEHEFGRNIADNGGQPPPDVDMPETTRTEHMDEA